MYETILGALAILACVAFAGAAIYVASWAVGQMNINRLRHRRTVAVARGEARAAEIQTEMTVRQLEVRKDALLDGLNGKQLGAATLPIDWSLAIEKGDVEDADTPSPNFYCRACGTTYVYDPPHGRDRYGEQLEFAKCSSTNINGTKCGGRILKIEKATVEAIP